MCCHCVMGGTIEGSSPFVQWLKYTAWYCFLKAKLLCWVKGRAWLYSALCSDKEAAQKEAFIACWVDGRSCPQLQLTGSHTYTLRAYDDFHKCSLLLWDTLWDEESMAKAILWNSCKYWIRASCRFLASAPVHVSMSIRHIHFRFPCRSHWWQSKHSPTIKQSFWIQFRQVKNAANCDVFFNLTSFTHMPGHVAREKKKKCAHSFNVSTDWIYKSL